MPIFIRWFPPAWFQIKTSDKIIYIDPAYLRTYYTHYPGKIEFSKWPEQINGLPEELEKADLILVTHNHKDHAKSVTVNRLRTPDTLVVAPKCCIKELSQDIRTIRPREELPFAGTKVKAVDAYNISTSAPRKIWHRKGDGVGYMLTLEGITIYHAGDTDFIPEMRELGAVDVALLPIGGTFTMDTREAIEAALVIRPKIVIPMHRLKAEPQEFKIILEAKTDIKVALLQVGQAWQLE